MEAATHYGIDELQAPVGHADASTPFSQETVVLSKQAYIQLKWEANYWKRQHELSLNREGVLTQKLERAKAQVRDLKRRYFGKRSEKGSKKTEALAPADKAKQPRGQRRGGRGHGRTARPDLPVVEEVHKLDESKQACLCCGLPYEEIAGTEDSQIVEIQVQGYIRKIRRQRYRRACQCKSAPVIITAPAAARLIPKSPLGISVWTEVLLDKYLYARPTNRLCVDMRALGIALAQGTLTGGLKKLLPLFKPLMAALLEKQLSERLFHGDETRWQVFEQIENKVGYRWYLWITQSASVVFYRMAPTRGAVVPKGHFGALDPAVQVILVCDRYSAYKSLVKEFPMILLAFCWAHVRRDFLEGSRNWPALEAWMLTWVEAIGHLYHLNAQRLEVWDERLSLADQSPAFTKRHQALQERLEQMRERRDELLGQTTLHSAQKKVLTSLKNHWSGLTVFVAHPQVPMDNNQAERSQRNPVTGRKNYYGSGAIWSAELAAMLFSVLQTIILWGLNPRHWLQDYLTACAQNGGRSPAQLTPHLPWSMDEQRREMLKRPLPSTGFSPAGKLPDLMAPDTS